MQALVGASLGLFSVVGLVVLSAYVYKQMSQGPYLTNK